MMGMEERSEEERPPQIRAPFAVLEGPGKQPVLPGNVVDRALQRRIRKALARALTNDAFAPAALRARIRRQLRQAQTQSH